MANVFVCSEMAFADRKMLAASADSNAMQILRDIQAYIVYVFIGFNLFLIICVTWFAIAAKRRLYGGQIFQRKSNLDGTQ